MSRKKGSTKGDIEVFEEAVEEKRDREYEGYYKRRRSPGPFLSGLLFGAVAIIAVLLLLGKIPNPFDPDDDTSGRLIGESIQEISELATLEYDYTYVGEFKKSRNLDFSFVTVDIPFTEKTFIASFDGTIKYGINLKNLDEPKTNDANKTITFSMPKVVELSHEIDFKSVKQWHKENNLFYPIQPSDTVEFQKENQKRAEKQAVKRGIIKKVQDHTTSVITSFVHTLFPEYKDYKIKCNYPSQKTIERITNEDVESQK